MLNNWIIVAIGAGLTAAALHATVVTGSPVALVLFYLAPLPLFLAGLGWAPITAALGGLAGAAALAFAVNFKTGLFFLLSTGVAPVLLSHLALINRQAQAGAASEGEAADQQVEWYPEGRLILWCALAAGVLMTATVFVVGGTAEGFEATVTEALETILKQMAGTMRADELVQVRQAVSFFAKLAAPLAAAIWLLSTLLNLWIASRLLRASGRSPRPWAPFASYTLPRSAGLILGGSLVAAMLPGTLGLIGLIAAMLMVTVFTVIGLATLHGLTLGNPMRGIILASTYMALFVLTWIAMLPLVILALADQQFNLRDRQSSAGPQDE